ncbi:SMI1/KNR4 family protein [Hahella chejuensis]|uniref:SMI1/KNR4 family protein n=1 Tax=Hahella chejuensis TaxID=158327 RepID=UPI0005A19A33|nr:SMI1/KNR4 family protein [Hahella chejuensis]
MSVWSSYVDMLVKLGVDFELLSGANFAEIQILEALVGFGIPRDLKEIYFVNNGQKYGFGPIFIDAYNFLSTHAICDVWNMWRESLDEHEDIGWRKSWLPFSQNIAGDIYCCVLMDEEVYKAGNILRVGTQSDQERLLSNDINNFLRDTITSVKSGKVVYREDLNAIIGT